MALVIGLAGQIACGKSTVAAELQRRGAVIISGDDLGRGVVAPGSPALRKLAKAFGGDVIDPAGQLRRESLGKIVFADPAKTKILNDIVHPELLRRLRRQIADYQQSKQTKLIVVDAALIFDWKFERALDCVIVVDSRRSLQLARLAAKGIDRATALARIRRQLPKYVLRRKADIVLENNGDQADLRRRAGKLWDVLQATNTRKSS